MSSLPNDDFLESRSTDFYLPAKYRLKSTRDKYQIGRQLGHGNFAVVHEALDKTTNQNVAIKIMEKSKTPRSLCERELGILEEVSVKIGRNRITPIVDVFEDKERLYFVLELMNGGDFFEHVAENGKLTESQAAPIIRKLCFTLDALHQHGILHRDIKLENLLINKKKGDDESSFRLADFGFAKQMGETDVFGNPAGTLGYAAPEVLEDRNYSPACDVWSTGIILYILLCGYPPFPRKGGPDPKTPQENLEVELEAIKHGRESERWNRDLSSGAWKNISPEAKKLLSKMLRLDPSKRYTITQVLNDPWIISHCKRRGYEYLNFE